MENICINKQCPDWHDKHDNNCDAVSHVGRCDQAILRKECQKHKIKHNSNTVCAVCENEHAHKKLNEDLQVENSGCLAARQLIQQGLEILEMVYNLHEDLIDHNEIMWRGVKRINKGLNLLSTKI